MTLSKLSRERLGRLATATVLASLLLYMDACSSDSGKAPEPSPPDITGAVYVGAATDEGLLTLLQAKPKERPSAAPVITTPEPGGTVSEATTFAYRFGAVTKVERAPAERSRAARVRRLLNLVGPVRHAHAHGEPMNGPAFLLSFSTRANPELLRVFTQETEYLPGTAEWQTLASAGTEITLVVTLAVFDQGRITDDGGPFQSEPVTFTVEP